MLAAASLFFPFSFFPFFSFIRTCQLRPVHLTLPSHRRYPVGAAINPVGANSTPQLQRQPKAPDKSFPFLSSFIFNGAGHPPPRCRPVAAPHGTQAPTPPPLAPMQAAPALLPQPPPPQYLYNRSHLTDTVALQPASPDFVTQTGGAKGALGPTISATPPFTHPPHLCRSSHLSGCPHCAP